jgi:hypothetical protein
MQFTRAVHPCENLVFPEPLCDKSLSFRHQIERNQT